MKQLPIKIFFIILAFVSYGSTFAAPSSTQREKYVYESPLDVGLDLQVYRIKYKNYSWAPNTTLDKEGVGFNLGLEWIPVVSVVGKVALSGGLGFASVTDAPVSSGSQATLYVVPVYLGLTYRADFFKNQVVVPFVSSGLDFGFSTQSSKTGATQSGVRTYDGYYYSGGVELCLNAFDPSSGRELDSRVGINGVYLVILYTQSEPFNSNETVNLSHKEFRLGVRFEI